MKDVIEIIIGRDRVTVVHPNDGEDLLIEGTEGGLQKQLAGYCAGQGLSSQSLILYISEDILYFKKLQLPIKTVDLNEAVGYQLSLLLPFPGDCFHSFVTVRNKKEYDVLLYAVSAQPLQGMVEDLIGGGFLVRAIFPESQRYVTVQRKKIRWGLLIGENSGKLFSFDGLHLQERWLCRDRPTLDQARGVCQVETILSTDASDEDFQPAVPEKSERRQFDLLPDTFRKPDYFRKFLVVLVALNFLALIGLAGMKEYRLWSQGKELSAQISAIEPRVKEAGTLLVKEKSLLKSVERIENLGQNFDLIRFLEKLTVVLPETAYLDQLRMDKKTGAINVQGYSEDIGELTKQLQELGDAKLKSTRRRKNKTYFHVEVSRK